MLSLNKTMVAGRTVKDPEEFATKDGKKGVNFTIAVNDKVNKEHVEYFDLTAYGVIAENIAKYVKKGTALFVEARQYTNVKEQDGKKTYYKTLIVDTFQFIESKKVEQ